MKILTTFLISLIITLTFAGCTITHEYGPYDGKVVDAETKEPIEGAAVLVVFYTETWGLTVSQSKFIDAVEVLTDENGEYKIAGKRITGIRPLHSWNPHGYVTIFKPGYGCYPFNEGVKPIFIPNGALPSNEYVLIELPKLRTKQERLKNTMIYLSSEIPMSKHKRLSDMINQELRILGIESKQEGID
jgi:hypothetical protein